MRVQDPLRGACKVASTASTRQGLTLQAGAEQWGILRRARRANERQRPGAGSEPVGTLGTLAQSAAGRWPRPAERIGSPGGSASWQESRGQRPLAWVQGRSIPVQADGARARSRMRAKKRAGGPAARRASRVPHRLRPGSGASEAPEAAALDPLTPGTKADKRYLPANDARSFAQTVTKPSPLPLLPPDLTLRGPRRRSADSLSYHPPLPHRTLLLRRTARLPHAPLEHPLSRAAGQSFSTPRASLHASPHSPPARFRSSRQHRRGLSCRRAGRLSNPVPSCKRLFKPSLNNASETH